MPFSHSSGSDRYHLLRSAAGEVLTLPTARASETVLPVIDHHRWGLAQLHRIAPELIPAGRWEDFASFLKAFSDPIKQPEGWARIHSWGYDEDGPYYVCAFPDGEVLSDYIHRVGPLPLPLVAYWISQLCQAAMERVELCSPLSFCSTEDFEIVQNSEHEIHIVRTGFFSSYFPESELTTSNDTLACCFARMFHAVAGEESSEWPSPLQDALTRILGGKERNSVSVQLEQFRDALLAVLGDQGKADRLVSIPPPRSPLRAWFRSEGLAAVGSDRALSEEHPLGEEKFALSTIIRGSETRLQVIPGPDFLPRHLWLEQHYVATRRLGRGHAQQLQVTFLEDAGSLSLIGEESIQGMSLARWIASHGPLSPESADILLRRIRALLDEIEGENRSCLVWWLSPKNLFLVTSEDPTVSDWESAPLKIRVHQTTDTLLDGIDFPEQLRAMLALPAEDSIADRRSAVTLPLYWTALTGEPFHWHQTFNHPRIPADLAAVLEERRQSLYGVPESPSDVPDTPDRVVSSTAFDQAHSAPDSSLSVPDSSPSVPDRAHSAPLHWGLIMVAAVVFAAWIGYALATWSAQQGLYPISSVPASFALLPPEPLPTPAESLALAKEAWIACLVTDASSDSLRLLADFQNWQTDDSRLLAHLAERSDQRAPLALRAIGFVALSRHDLTHAAQYFSEAAELGDSEAAHYSALLAWQPGQPHSSEVAKVLRRAASLHPAASERLARFLLETGDSMGASAAMNQAAEEGWSSALHQMGIFLSSGIGCVVDAEKAAVFFRRASECGNLDAMFDFARCIEIGYGVGRSFPEARRWMQRAAALGHHSARIWLQERQIGNPVQLAGE